MCSPLLDFGTLFLISLSYFFLVPVGRALFALTTRDSDAPTRWTKSDLFILLLMFAVSSALCFRPDQNVGVGEEVVGLLLLYVMIYVGWYVGVQGLCENKVNDAVDRGLVLGVLLPPIFLSPLIWNLFNPILMVLTVIPALGLLIGAAIWGRISTRILKGVFERRTMEVEKTNARIKIISVAVLSVAVMCGSTTPLWASFLISPFTFMPGLRAYRAEVLQTADIPAIQNWMSQQDFSDPQINERLLKRENLPECVRRVPGWVCVNASKELVFVRGGGFGHWGLTVAPKGTPTPTVMGRNDVLGVSDGAWVFRENQ